MTTPADYRAWLRGARPGDCCVYHTGELARDRVRMVLDPSSPQTANGTGGRYLEVPVEPIHQLASEVYTDAQRGLVTLTQRRRRGDRGFDYLATRTSKETA